jgi:hypothetical protein
VTPEVEENARRAADLRGNPIADMAARVAPERSFWDILQPRNHGRAPGSPGVAW